MNGISELAKLFRERDNATSYSPMFGEIIELPTLKIRIGEKIVIDKSYVKACCNLYEQDSKGGYINKGKTVVLLPYSSNQKFIVVGVVQ